MEMTMFKTSQIANVKDMQYATEADFCKIFDEDMNSLYLLSLLLTGDQEKAEQCFVEGLENAVSRNRVFKEWANSWARRAIIQNALRITNPRPNGGTESWDSSSINRSQEASSECAEIAAVIGLEPFERFIFVMSVLEGYSDHDCSILLGCARRDVLAARNRALQRIGDAAGLHSRLQLTTGSEAQVMNDSQTVFGAAA
jgi:DNA-directed RNA polymerase specialized sigma24 family protein